MKRKLAGVPSATDMPCGTCTLSSGKPSGTNPLTMPAIG
jgi:hypothetical protein